MAWYFLWSTKVHKTVINNTPQFRPIFLAVNTPVDKLAKYLVLNLPPLPDQLMTTRSKILLLLLKRLLVLIIIFLWLA